jgi:hypothetical protein
MNKLHFCGGLPRSGSTILMNILQQNPKIFTTGTCALSDLITSHILVNSRYREQFQAMSIEEADRAMYGLIHGATKGWFEALTNKPTVISKNRNWSSAFHLYKESKYIAMVRDLRDVVESFEKVNDRTLALHSYGAQNIMVPAMHTEEKHRYYFNEANSISLSIETEIPRLIQEFQKGKGNVLFIRYEDFTFDPISTLKLVHQFLDEQWYDYDLNNISQSGLFEHDHAYFRERTDHKTNPAFQYYKPPVRNLPDYFHAKILKEYDWFYKGFYPHELATN